MTFQGVGMEFFLELHNLMLVKGIPQLTAVNLGALT